MLLEGVQSIFGRRAGYEVVGVGTCCDDAIRIAQDRRPNVLVLDLNMGGDAFACIREIRDEHPSTRVVTFTASASVHHAVHALDAGASGYVLKGGPLSSLVDAVDTVVQGETYITQGFATKVIAALRQARSSNELKLSVREDQIIRLILEGKTNKQIGEILKISEKTVKYYMTIIMQKLNVKNRVGVAVAARGVIGDGPHYAARSAPAARLSYN
jgi:DNA-binding NarL/FixJ family response regulator